VTPRRVLVVHCHPDPESLVSAAKDRAVSALGDAGHDVVVADLHAEGFDPLLDLDEWRAHAHEHTPDGSLAGHADHLRWADTIVFTYPTWFGGQPAMLKGWLDRVCTNGVAYRLPPGKAHIRGLLRNIRRIVVITSHGSSKWVNGLEGEPGKRVLRRGFRSLCHPLARTRWIALYGVDRAAPAARTQWLDRVARAVTR
jgi:putative NADPH-quinone reductase